MNVEWVRSLLGDAFLTVVIKKGKDITTVAHLGRHVIAEVQTALSSRVASARSTGAPAASTWNGITARSTSRTRGRPRSGT